MSCYPLPSVRGVDFQQARSHWVKVVAMETQTQTDLDQSLLTEDFWFRSGATELKSINRKKCKIKNNVK